MRPAPSLTITDVSLDGRRVTLRCADGLISALGPEVAPVAGDVVIPAAGRLLVPPLTNGHTHAAMTLLRGHGDDLPLMRWLTEAVWPVEARLTHEDVYWGVRLACLEMIASGTTRFWDMYWHPRAAAEAVRDAGLHATVGVPLIDADGDPAELRRGALAALEEIAEIGGSIAPALAPHAVYTVSEASLRWVGELAAERGLPIHIHVSETEREVQDCLATHGVRPIAYLDRLGVLGPDTVIAHGVWLDDAEWALLGERGATVVTNPVANLKLAVGAIFDYPAARRAGVPVALGTDGPASNNSLDLFDDVKVFALIQKHRAGDPAAVSAREAWAVATGELAPRLGSTPRLAVGQPADFLLLRADASELSVGELAGSLVYGASGAVVDTVVVGGRVLMRERRIDGADEVIARASERARGLGVGGGSGAGDPADA